MLKNKSEIQKAGIIVLTVLIIGGLIFAGAARMSYSKMSQNQKYINNASVQFDEETAQYIDYENTSLTYDILNQDLQIYNYIFKVRIESAEHCYNCTKYTFVILDSIKGNENKGNKAVLYQWGGIDEYENKLIFRSMDNSMPLKVNKEYLIFADKRDYYEAYQNTLECNEYSLGLRNSGPTAFILNETQNDFININHDTTYSALEDKYYTCFSQEALDNINKISKQIINEYSK